MKRNLKAEKISNKFANDMNSQNELSYKMKVKADNYTIVSQEVMFINTR